MANIPQILAMLETELSKQLVFSYNLEENLGRRQSRILLPGDRFLFAAYVRNDSIIPLKDVRGTISPTRSTGFPVTKFRLRELPAGQERRLCVVWARVTGPLQHEPVLNDVGTVTLAATADLSQLQFQERNKPLIQTGAPVTVNSARVHPPALKRQVRGIPLSPTTSLRIGDPD